MTFYVLDVKTRRELNIFDDFESELKEVMIKFNIPQCITLLDLSEELVQQKVKKWRDLESTLYARYPKRPKKMLTDPDYLSLEAQKKEFGKKKGKLYVNTDEKTYAKGEIIESLSEKLRPVG